MAEAKRTKDHEKIRHWVEHRGGRPAVVRSTWNGETGLLRIDFGEPEEELEEIEWEAFFRIFDEHDLAFLYQDEENSRFFKFVEAEESGI